MNSHVVLIAFIKSSKINDIDIEMPNEAIIRLIYDKFCMILYWSKEKISFHYTISRIHILNFKYPYQSLVVLCYNKTITYFE